MIRPSAQDTISLKRVCRYLFQRRNLRKTCVFDVIEDDLKHPGAFCDSDWATDTVSRRGTSGCIVKIGPAVIHSFSKTQTSWAVVKQSSCRSRRLCPGFCSSNTYYREKELETRQCACDQTD